jgi:hypothetical protein
VVAHGVQLRSVPIHSFTTYVFTTMRSIFETRHTNTAHAPIRRLWNLASRLVRRSSFAALRTRIAHGSMLVGCGAALLSAGAAAANPVTVELTGEVHTTARSGYAGKIVELGDPDRKDRALWGLYSEETSAFTNDRAGYRSQRNR